MPSIVKVQEAVTAIEERTTSRQMEAAKLFTAALAGDKRAKLTLQEGISSSDIPSLLEPIVNVTFLAKYAAEVNVWDQIADERTEDNFGKIKFGNFNIDATHITAGGGEEFIAGGLPSVGEYEEYQAVPFTTSEVEKEFEGKKGVRVRLSFETLRRTGDFNIISEMTDAFARAAARQEDISLAKLFVTTGGAIGTGFTGKGIAGNPALSLAALDTAMTASRTDVVDGARVLGTDFKLVYGSALRLTVRDMFAVQQIETTVGDTKSTFDPRLFTSPYSPIEFNALDTVSGGTTDAFWFVLPQNLPRPHFWQTFLSGARTPLISIKDSGHFSLGGGEVPFREGSFEEDDVQTRIRHIVQAIPMFKDGLRVSTGAGS